MKKNLAVAVAAIALFFGAFTSNANASYVTDGEFNNPWGGGGFTTYGTGGNFGGWNVVSGSVDLDGNSPGAINQLITTGAGSYVLNFSLSGNPDAGNGPKTVRVTVGTATHNFTYNISGSNNHSNMNYLAESLAFNTSGPTTLTFQSLSDGGPFGPVVSGVSVSAVPLPAALPFFLTSLLGMFGFKNFRRQTQLA